MTADGRGSGRLRKRAGWCRAWRGQAASPRRLDRPHPSWMPSALRRVWSVACPDHRRSPQRAARMLWPSGSELRNTPCFLSDGLSRTASIEDSASVPLTLCCNLPRSASRPPSPTRNSSLSRPDLDIDAPSRSQTGLLWAYKGL